jgi:hypothetical protein
MSLQCRSLINPNSKDAGDDVVNVSTGLDVKNPSEVSDLQLRFYNNKIYGYLSLPNYLILEIMNIFKFIESFTNDDLMQSHDLEEIV